ncbi:hypothetical protein [Bacillus sp. FJAT-26390]|uniref:hypothetical protein n=1 Tax=Bacillus sp. FJAT-26390 TaxID=1743142 RepID=UPI000807D3EF|nr:hypothetical protein [Bacillus sp. FJAT-26390]OBZ11263.1 hypothetical protein A7975_20145 [Bacillus sp. FJAT-26390]
MVKYKWTLMMTMLLIALTAAFLLQGMDRSTASGDLSDPFLDPYALSLAHRHAGPAMESAAEKGVRMQLSWPQGEPAAGESSLLALTVVNGRGATVNDFDISNEKLLHLIVVSKDLQQFQHVHPAYKGDGLFELPIAFPSGGGYKLYADFLPKGMNELTRMGEVEVQGAAAAPSILKPSESLVAHVDGMKVELAFAEKPVPQTAMNMTYTFTDEQTGEPIEDLELYLGAVGHVVAIDQKTEQFIHIHPLNWASSGPQAVFGVSFPAGGLYKIWGQFQRNGQTLIVPFVIQV